MVDVDTRIVKAIRIFFVDRFFLIVQFHLGSYEFVVSQKKVEKEKGKRRSENVLYVDSVIDQVANRERYGIGVGEYLFEKRSS